MAITVGYQSFSQLNKLVIVGTNRPLKFTDLQQQTRTKCNLEFLIEEMIKKRKKYWIRHLLTRQCKLDENLFCFFLARKDFEPPKNDTYCFYFNYFDFNDKTKSLRAVSFQAYKPIIDKFTFPSYSVLINL